jgi:hypothetical protein
LTSPALCPTRQNSSVWVKIKLKISLDFIKHYAMNTWRWVVRFKPLPLYPSYRRLDEQLLTSWRKENISCTYRWSNTDSSVIHPIA